MNEGTVPLLESGDEGFDLTPLIDVVFILLMFFLVATTITARQEQITVKLPESASGEATEEASRALIVTLHADGTLLLGGEAVEREALVERLRSDKAEAVRINGDGETSLRDTIALYDLCTRAGIGKITLGTTPEAPR